MYGPYGGRNLHSPGRNDDQDLNRISLRKGPAYVVHQWTGNRGGHRSCRGQKERKGLGATQHHGEVSDRFKSWRGLSRPRRFFIYTNFNVEQRRPVGRRCVNRASSLDVTIASRMSRPLHFRRGLVHLLSSGKPQIVRLPWDEPKEPETSPTRRQKSNTFAEIPHGYDLLDQSMSPTFPFLGLVSSCDPFFELEDVCDDITYYRLVSQIGVYNP